MLQFRHIYDSGDAKIHEDGFFGTKMNNGKDFFGLISDAFSAPFSGPQPRPFNGRSGGELVSRKLESFSAKYYPKLESGAWILSDFLINANKRIGSMQDKQGISLKNASDLAAASHVAVHIDHDRICIIKAGDCAAIWVGKDGTIGHTEDENFQVEKMFRDEIARLKVEIGKKYGHEDLKTVSPEEMAKITGEMWIRFVPFLREGRTQHINNPQSQIGFALLNGQKTYSTMWTEIEIPREELKTLILSSDGLMVWEKMTNCKSKKAFVSRILDTCQNKGLEAVLPIIRGIEAKGAHLSHTTAAELTAAIVSF